LALSRSGAARLAAACAVVGAMAFTAPAFGADFRVVKVFDDCDPATFNEAFGPPDVCVGDGRTLVDDFLAEFDEKGSIDRWAFSRPEFNIDEGGTIQLVSEGGETHTFTEVTKFGNGCIPLFDDPEAEPAFDCTEFPDVIVATSGIAAGATRSITGLEAGTHLFECAIHPWMRSTVDVRAKGHRGGRG
jgi:hypothetical protein